MIDLARDLVGSPWLLPLIALQGLLVAVMAWPINSAADPHAEAYGDEPQVRHE